MEIINKTSEPVGVLYYGKSAVIGVGENLKIPCERIGESIKIKSKKGEVTIFRKFDSRVVTKSETLKTSEGNFFMQVIIHE